MFAIASGQVHSPAGSLPAASPATVPPPSLSATIRHGFAIGIAATVVQILIALALLYACGILAP